MTLNNRQILRDKINNDDSNNIIIILFQQSCMWHSATHLLDYIIART